MVFAKLFRPNHPSVEAARDEVALSVLRCQVLYGGKTKDWKVSLELLKAAHGLAASESARGRIEENIEIVEGNLMSSTCWFCEENPGVDDKAIEFKLHGDVTREQVGFGKVNIKWNTLTVRVPRCPDCQKKHRDTLLYTCLGLLIGFLPPLLGGDVVALFTWRGEALARLLGLAFLTCVVGAVVGYMLGQSRSPKTKAEYKTKQYPPIQRKLAEGWKPGERPEGMQ